MTVGGVSRPYILCRGYCEPSSRAAPSEPPGGKAQPLEEYREG